MNTTFTPAAADFPRAEIVPMGEDFVLISYPAFQYAHATNSENTPITADRGAVHLGERVPGIAVPFPSRNHGMMHKHFGIGFYEGGDGGEAGQPFVYGKGVSLTAEKRGSEFLSAANLDDVILLKGKRYAIRKAPNDNIELEEV